MRRPDYFNEPAGLSSEDWRRLFVARIGSWELDRQRLRQPWTKFEEPRTNSFRWFSYAGAALAAAFLLATLSGQPGLSALTQAIGFISPIKISAPAHETIATPAPNPAHQPNARRTSTKTAPVSTSTRSPHAGYTPSPSGSSTGRSGAGSQAGLPLPSAVPSPAQILTSPKGLPRPAGISAPSPKPPLAVS